MLMSESYSKNETDLMLKPIHNELTLHREAHAAIYEKVDLVHQEVKKTNGRVKSLELWKAGLAGATAVLTLLVVPVLIYLIKSVI